MIKAFDFFPLMFFSFYTKKVSPFFFGTEVEFDYFRSLCFGTLENHRFCFALASDSPLTPKACTYKGKPIFS